MRWMVASIELNAVRSPRRGVVATVYSSSVAIGSAVSSCVKKGVESDEVLRFVVSGPRLKVLDVDADDGLMSGPLG
jgi:hypothetical protein